MAISIHALREEGDTLSLGSLKAPNHISIHALREEGDVTDCYTRIKDGQFLSTPSARRATNYRHLILAAQNISIHALREEGDPDALAY